MLLNKQVSETSAIVGHTFNLSDTDYCNLVQSDSIEDLTVQLEALEILSESQGSQFMALASYVTGSHLANLLLDVLYNDEMR